MPQPSRQQRQLRLNVHAGAIPANQCVYSATVTKVMNSRPSAVGFLDSGAGEQNAQVCLQASAGVSAVPAVWTP